MSDGLKFRIGADPTDTFPQNSLTAAFDGKFDILNGLL